METDTSNQVEKEKRFISYFQSVLTIGIMSRGKNVEEAEARSMEKMNDKSGVNYCIFEQTPFELNGTDEWKPEMEIDQNEDGIVFNFNPDDKTKNIIATRLGKSVADLTEDDFSEFVKMSIESSLKT